MQLPGPVGPAWNLRLFRQASLGFFLGTIALVIICLGPGRLPQAAVFAVSALIFGCHWQFAWRCTTSLERWSRRPGYRQRNDLSGRTSADSSRPD